MNDKELLPWLEKMLTGDEAAFRVVYQATHTDDYQDENGVMHEDRLTAEERKQFEEILPQKAAPFFEKVRGGK